MDQVRRTSAWLGLCFWGALAGASPAQEARPVPVAPAPVDVPWIRGNGHAETWDGRLFVVTRAGGVPQGKWDVRVFRPETLQRDAAGRPRFEAANVSPWVVLERGDAPGNGLNLLNALALAPAPGFPENPFPSDAAGQPQANGAYSTYELLVFSQRYQPHPAPPIGPGQPGALCRGDRGLRQGPRARPQRRAHLRQPRPQQGHAGALRRGDRRLRAGPRVRPGGGCSGQDTGSASEGRGRAEAGVSPRPADRRSLTSAGA